MYLHHMRDRRLLRLPLAAIAMSTTPRPSRNLRCLIRYANVYDHGGMLTEGHKRGSLKRSLACRDRVPTFIGINMLAAHPVHPLGRAVVIFFYPKESL